MKNVNILKIGSSQKVEKTTDAVPEEKPLHIKLNGKDFVTLLSTPTDTKELAIGFLLTEGLIKNADDIVNLEVSEEKVIIEVRVSRETLQDSPAIITSGCGRGVIFRPLSNETKITGKAKFSSWLISRLMKEFLTYSTRYGVHSAALADSKKGILIFKEDIGRHNAIDKVVGATLLQGIEVANKILLSTGRISSEMVLKSARLGIPILVARSCPTTSAIQLADTAGMTIIGQVKAGSMNIYTHQRRIISNLVERIKEIKEAKHAIILAHNYQRGEVQDIADFVGDSLDLSRKAAQTDAKIIVFCGVHFMAETAKILSPDKTVLMPDINAGCPMADMVSVENLRQTKAEYPDALVVSYVNTHVEVKAESDYCCTSANGVKVINSLPPNQKIIFTPDKYLGDYITRQTGREMILMPGYCPTHQTITPEGIHQIKKEHPQVKVIVHPECSQGVIAVADAALSTNGMCRYVKESEGTEFIIGTEVGIIHRLKKENPQKQFYPASTRAVCPNMKLTTLEKILFALEDEEPKIEVPHDIAQKAKLAIDRMLAIS
ncbi:MAG: quinolinate synthase NadA [bacterium]